MTSSKRKICQAVALIVTAMGASVAMAATPSLISGGSSLVGPSITAEFLNFSGGSSGSAHYFQTNSATGQAAFLTNNSALYGTTGPVHFGNSDSALLLADINTYAAGRALTDGRLIQLPFVTTPITIPLTNAPTGTSKPLPLDPAATPTVALNDDDLCGIFSGKMTNWNQVINPDTGVTYATNRAIHVVYRSDGSGTSDLLTRHLHAVCTTANTASGVTFAETQTFANNFASGVPATFQGASGSGGVAAALVALRDVPASTTISAIGYLSPDFTNKFLATSTLAPAATNGLSVASLRNSHLNLGTGNANDVVPTAANASTAVSAFSPPTLKAAVLLQTNWVPPAADPAAGYPISGTTNLILSQCYASPAGVSPTPTAAVLEFLNEHYTGAADASIIAANGFAVVPSNWQAAITKDFLTAGTTFGSEINNSAACTATGVTGR